MSLPVHYFLKNIRVFVAVWCLCETVLLLLSGVTSQQQKFTLSTATLSQARGWLTATSSGELVFFGGGDNTLILSDRVDVCNVTSGSWTTATLSIPRYALAAASSGNLVFFAGGWDGSEASNRVDIYDILDGNWSVATLSQGRYNLAATSVGSLVLFVGGDNNGPTATVDIYNVTSNTWTNTTLSQARYDVAATSVANQYALVAGGDNGSDILQLVDIYDSMSGVWNTASLSQARYLPVATSFGNLAFFGGGWSGGRPSNVVDIFNATTQTWSTATLSQARYFLAAASIGDVVAFGGGATGDFTANAVVDMYNATSNIWFTANLSQPRFLLAATSSTNKIFFGGGVLFDTVDIFDFSSRLPYFLPQAPSFVPSAPQTPISAPLVNYPQVQPVENNLSATTPTVLIGVFVSALVALSSAVVILAILLTKEKRKRVRKQRKQEQRDANPMPEQKRSTVVLDSVGDTISQQTKTILSTYQPGSETLKRLSPGQIPLNELEIDKEIGNGTYGRVCEGKWKKYRVALKFCQNKGQMDEFMREANLMISLPPHPNVVRMYGVSIDGTQPIIVMEYCAGGSLDKLLYDKTQHISEEQKIRWVHEIALGMCHLHQHNIVHRDLAARNMLLSHSNPAIAQLKISDFGMSRVLQQDIESKTKSGTGPVCWMAPESIAKKIYSKKSDVWMFGVLIYEIVARCEPHGDKDPLRTSVEIRESYITPDIPRDCPMRLRELMEMCWQKQPDQRPSFEAIVAILSNSVSHVSETQYTDI